MNIEERNLERYRSQTNLLHKEREVLSVGASFPFSLQSPSSDQPVVPSIQFFGKAPVACAFRWPLFFSVVCWNRCILEHLYFNIGLVLLYTFGINQSILFTSISPTDQPSRFRRRSSFPRADILIFICWHCVDYFGLVLLHAESLSPHRTLSPDTTFSAFNAFTREGCNKLPRRKIYHIRSL